MRSGCSERPQRTTRKKKLSAEQISVDAALDGVFTVDEEVKAEGFSLDTLQLDTAVRNS